MIYMELWTYRHYKWSLCDVVGIAQHTETGEEMVVYTHYDEHGNTTLRVRPLHIFQETIVVDWQQVQRFTHIQK